MAQQRELIEEVDLNKQESQAAQPSEMAVYVSDLLGELQVICKISGMNDLANDIDGLMRRHLHSH